MTTNKDSKDCPKRGRKTLYRPEYCDQIIEFFTRPLTHTIDTEYTLKSGVIKKQPVEVAERLPTLEAFAGKIGTHTSVLHDWTKVHPEFKEAHTRAKELFKEHLIQNAITGRYDSRFATFLAINTTDMRNTQTVDLTQTGPVIIKVKDFGIGKINKKK